MSTYTPTLPEFYEIPRNGDHLGSSEHEDIHTIVLLAMVQLQSHLRPDPATSFLLCQLCVSHLERDYEIEKESRVRAF